MYAPEETISEEKEQVKDVKDLTKDVLPLEVQTTLVASEERASISSEEKAKRALQKIIEKKKAG